MGNSFLLIVAGLLLFYLVISDKWSCVENFVGCIAGGASSGNGLQPTSFDQQNSPATPSVSNLPTIAQNTNWMHYGV